MTASASATTEILLAGATGGLGLRIAKALRARGAGVRAVVRRGTSAERIALLREIGVTVVELDRNDLAKVTSACVGVDCVVSALNGLHETIIGTQSMLLDAAVSAGVPRFIPSDFCLDYTRTPAGSNRNMDLRRKFKKRLDVAPTGIVRAVFAMLLRDMPNDAYFKVGLITVIGLTAKNAILIIEVAKELVAQGRSTHEAALQACELRFRPIVMTSVAFILGMVPLAIATGASMNSQRAIGTGVLGGMITATVLAVFATPLFYFLIARAFRRRSRARPATAALAGGYTRKADIPGAAR